ncbi:MAG: leucine-rich repeat domain-containing protein [Chlamydiales bacterium]|nr:leucine-rich repeat domain-containing protein [Chlamydiales bacterium]
MAAHVGFSGLGRCVGRISDTQSNEFLCRDDICRLCNENLDSSFLNVTRFTSQYYIHRRGTAQPIYSSRDQTLNLNGISIESLPSLIGNFTYLQHLGMENTSLTSLPAEIGLLCNLEELNLQNNPLSSLPPEIEKLTNLRVLTLSNTRLTSLPKGIFNLPGTCTIHLINCPLSRETLQSIRESKGPKFIFEEDQPFQRLPSMQNQVRLPSSTQNQAGIQFIVDRAIFGQPLHKSTEGLFQMVPQSRQRALAEEIARSYGSFTPKSILDFLEKSKPKTPAKEAEKEEEVSKEEEIRREKESAKARFQQLSPSEQKAIANLHGLTPEGLLNMLNTP